MGVYYPPWVHTERRRIWRHVVLSALLTVAALTFGLYGGPR